MKTQKLILLFCLVGFILSGILVSQHYSHLASLNPEKSFCSINSYVDCDAVSQSAYGSFLGIPTSGWGFLFYSMVFLATLGALFSSDRTWLAFQFELASLGIAISAWMAYLSFFKIKAMCILCVGMYVTNLLIWIASYKTLQGGIMESLKNSISQASSWVKHGLAAVLVLGIGLATFSSMAKTAQEKRQAQIQLRQAPQAGEEPPMTLEQAVDLHFGQPKINLDTTGKPFFGNPNAKVVFVEFSDYQCPFCKRAAEYFKTALSPYKNDVAFYYINYPLDMSCNPQMTRPMHPFACKATQAAICAGAQGKFWEYHDLVFDNQAKFAPELFSQLAQKLGLNTQALETCMASQTTADFIKSDIELAKSAQIQGTPSVFLNGRRVNGWQNPEFFKAILEEELQKN